MPGTEHFEPVFKRLNEVQDHIDARINGVVADLGEVKADVKVTMTLQTLYAEALKDHKKKHWTILLAMMGAVVASIAAFVKSMFGGQ